MNLGDAAVGPPVGRRMKARAPPPPRPPQPAPRKIFRNAVPDGGGSSGGESKENILQSTVDLHITLPAGYQTTISVDGRKALMDLLVDLCSQYHLNPADHTLELLSPDAQPVSYKPNALLGALDVSCALIKQRVLEDKVVRKPPPKVPEKTVRLVVNYHRNQKAVVRVNPMVPLRALVPVICQKCEFDPAHVLLLKDNINNHELDLDKTLSDQDIRELYALDQAIVLQPKMASTPALNYSAESLHSNSLSGSEKKGLLGFLKFNRRKSKTEDQFSEDMDSPDDDSVVENADTNVNGMASGPCVETRPSTLGQSQSVMNISRMSPKVELKKRRAPAPPSALTQTLPLVSQRSLGSPSSHNLLKKRKAPPPPPSPTPSTPEPVIHTPVPTAPVCAPSIPMPTERTMMPPANTTGPADDSQSDLSHSIEDSEPAGSICSSSSGEDVAAESSASSLAEEPVADQATGIAAYTISTPEPDIAPECMEEPAPHVTLEKQPGPSPKSEDSESALELKMEEMENNRNSGIGWLHSAHESVLEKTVEQEVETVSVASSESFADQGYAASEGMAEEPSLASTSERIQSASPVDIVSLNSGSGPAIKQSKDSSSDSDEGCATWGSRHSSRNIQSGHKPVKELNSYEEDPEITAQIHLTLADLDANLADINQSDGAPIFVDDEIPVSIVDVDIPVTTIDEVPDDDRCSMSEYKAPLLHSTQNIISHSCTPCEAIQNKNKNNNVCLTEEKTVNPSRAAYKQLQEPRLTDIKKNVSQSPASQKQSLETKLRNGEKNVSQSPASQKQSLETKLRNGEKNVSLSPVIQKQLQFAKFTDTKEQNVTMTSDNKDKAGTQELKVQKDSVSPKSQSPVVCPTVQSVQKADDRQKFVPVVQMPRTETANEDRTPITRVPPTQGKITKNPVSRFGMKTFTVIPPKPTVSQTHKPAGSLVIGAIKIDEQGNMVTRRQITTAPEKHSSHEEVTCGTKSPLGQAKAFWSSAEKQDQATMTNQGSMMKGKDTDVFEPPLVSGVSKLSVKSHPEEKPKEIIILEKNPISVVGSNLSFQEPKEKHSLTGERRDLPFLKPFRKTSSQYVASAIAKNNSIQNTKTDSIQEPSQSTVHIKKLPLNQQINNDIRPINTLSEGPTKPVKTFKASESSMPVVGGPKHSQSYPSHVAEKLESPEKISSLVKGTLHGGTKSLDSHTINNEITSFNKFPNTTSSQHTPKHNTGLPLTKKPEVHKSEIASEPNMFGPVKKFKPVIFQPVQKDTSLHSSLMEAIQSGGGIERLRKVSDSSSSSTVKKPSYTDSENQLSALLSAIRAPSNSARLRKTISGASKELEQLRQAEENRNVQKEITAPPPTSPPAFEALSPPAFSPPPPPPLAPAKPPPVLPAGGNPEAAREALLEAIRSGSGAQRLRKVPVTQKRRQVNGRLRTIQATSPLSHGH